VLVESIVAHVASPAQAWALPQFSWLRRIELYEPLLSAVDAEWRRRLEQESSRPRALPADLILVASKLVSAGLRELTRRHHPDLGGEGAVMARVNTAAAWLRAVINGA
jgi:hypothetical protein